MSENEMSEDAIHLERLLNEHVPSLSDEDDWLIDERRYNGFDNADLAVRTCRCGRKIDGFYDYIDHLKEMLYGEGVPSPD